MKAHVFKIHLTNTKREEKDLSDMLHTEILRKQHKSPAFSRFFSIFGLIFFVLSELYIVLLSIILSILTPLGIGVIILNVVGILYFGTMDWVSYYDRCIVRGIVRIEKLFKSDGKNMSPLPCFFIQIMP